MSDTPLRIGLIGAGYIGAVHSAGWRSVTGTYPEVGRDIHLAAVADADAGRAEALRRSWEWERSATDWQTLTRAEDLDIIDVCVPNALHAEVVLDALAHGKHVVCEKPLAHNVDSARAMAEAAAASRFVSQVCFYYRLWPAIAWARELIANGTIGDVHYFRGWMLQDYAARSDHNLGWRADRTQAGAGALGDLGSHIYDIAHALVGDITELCATSHTLVPRVHEQQIDDAISALVHFESGAGGVVEASWALRGHKCDLGFDVVGTAGAVRFSWERFNEIEVLSGNPDDPANGFKRVLVGDGQGDAGRFVAVAGQGLGYRDAFTIGLGHLAAAITNGTPDVAPSFTDGLRVAELVEASARSAEERCWVTVGQ